MKKILIISKDFSHKGGVVNYVNLLIKNLSKEKFKTEHFVQGRSSVSLKNIFLPLIIFCQLIKFMILLKRFKPDVVHLNPSFKILSLLRDSFYLIIINTFYHINTLAMFHGWDNDLANKVMNNFFYDKLFKKIYRRAYFILTLCNNYKEQLVKMGISPENVKVITTMYQNIKIIEDNQNSNFNNKINILFMSLFIESKGVYIAAEIVRLLVKGGYKDFKFIFAGDGPEYRGLKCYINKYGLADYIEAPGYILGNKKQEILKKSDIFLFPTYCHEGCPLVILEAMGAGLAVVSTPMGAIPDIVKNNKNGFIINSKDPKDFYEAIKTLIEDRELLSRIQKLNRKEAEENYEVKVVTKKMESIYFSIIND